ncbi:hypothetical protein [Spodoptera cosmioides nucleopolyhedrovirus]|uniref:Uncharacterized protein n=1 Tax=Spodoptera cosmioides nucleopolyhedrovirus TaxID=2605774 RepID=A0A6B7KKX5_9ABAC|nr:hypothetical protein [Spodoptera cosmioides nucleopolyhedrovirus]
MFAFEYPPTGDSISVYFDLKYYYFDYYELMILINNSVGDVVEKKNCSRIVKKMRKLKFLRPHQAIVLLDCFLCTKKIQAYVFNVVYPVLVKYKKSLKL